MSIHLSSEQEEAIDLCADLDTKIACVTGQAGTGKTTCLKYAYDKIFESLCELHNISAEEVLRMKKEERPFHIQLCAPTGRAAKRIEEATGIEARTIHRMMRYSMPKDDDDYGLPAYSKQNPLFFDAIFIDEASMLTNELRRAVIDAMKRGSVIRFFGDINQLPPIKSSSPFAKDLDKFPSVYLSTNFRSTDGIIELADRVIKNKMPLANDQVIIQRVISTMGLPTIVKLAEKTDFTSVDNQIICPTNKTTHGTSVINKMIQQKFNLEKDKITVFQKDHDGLLITRSFKRGDKFLWTQNDYNLDLMNGTTGKILDFDKETGTVYVSVEGRDIAVPNQIENYNPTTGEKYYYDPRHYLDLGYAISTHKSQGSQFHTVLYVCSRTRAATRQNVYTGVTRAREKLIILNVAGSLTFAIENKVNIFETN